jgi:hypothetical protein
MKYATLSLAVLTLIRATGPQPLSSSVQGIRFGEPALAPGYIRLSCQAVMPEKWSS